MDLKRQVAGLWQEALLRLMPQGLEQENSLLFWRTKILTALLLFGTIMGAVSLVPVFFLALKEKLWLLFISDSAMCAAIAGLMLARRMDFRVRAGLTLGLVYLVGIVVILFVGIISGGPAWLFAFAVLAGVLLGHWGALWALAMNTVTMLVIGLFLFQGTWGVVSGSSYPPELVLTGIINFLFMNGGAALSVSVLVKGMMVADENEVRLTSSLKEKQVRLAGEIRDRKEANQAREASEERYRRILDSIEDGYFEVDLKGNLTFFNGALARMAGAETETLLGMNNRAFMDEANARKIARAFRRSYETGEPSQVLDCRLIRKDGAVRRIEMVVSLIRDSRGTVTGFRGIARDVSDRVAMEKQLQQSSKMESVGTLAAGIAHDFNNVLYIIVGNADLALDDLPRDQPVRQNLEQIKSASLRAADIVKQLLSFSRESEHHLTPLDLTTVIRDELRFLRSTFPAYVDIVADLCPGPVPVMGDKVQIKQLMINLFTNAVQAMEGRGGQIRLVLTLLPEDPGAQGTEGGRMACLVIQDSGPGIQRENLDRVFDPYFTTKEVGKGSGMGLSVVHGIVKNHGGRIGVSSPPGDGARFQVLLPLTDSPLPATEDLKPRDRRPSRGRERLLLVDDEKVIVETNGQILERLGYRVKGFYSPEKALAEFSAQPDAYDLVMTDMTMPGMTGDVLAARILALAPKMPVILCTGHSDLLDKARAAEMGIWAMMPKPATLERLAQTVRAALDRT